MWREAGEAVSTYLCKDTVGLYQVDPFLFAPDAFGVTRGEPLLIGEGLANVQHLNTTVVEGLTGEGYITDIRVTLVGGIDIDVHQKYILRVVQSDIVGAGDYDVVNIRKGKMSTVLECRLRKEV